MNSVNVTEQESNHKDLEKKTIAELVDAMHFEDNNALKAVNKVLPDVTELIKNIVPKIRKGGRLFYASGMNFNRKPFTPTIDDLHQNGRNFPPNFLHESWMDYLYWDVELLP